MTVRAVIAYYVVLAGPTKIFVFSKGSNVQRPRMCVCVCDREGERGESSTFSHQGLNEPIRNQGDQPLYPLEKEMGRGTAFMNVRYVRGSL